MSEHDYRYPVSEIFGPVCQGEGQLIGKPTIFVRLGGCDYRCSWCDSLYAVLPEHRNDWIKMTASQILWRVKQLLPADASSGHVTLSGGNPAIHPCGPLVFMLQEAGLRVAIETQGSVAPEWIYLVDDLTISPKPPSSGNVTEVDAGSPLAKLIDGAPKRSSVCLKVVAFDDMDYDYARHVHVTWPGIPFFLQAGTDVGQASRDDLCDALIKLQDRVCADPLMQDIAVLPQLHAVLKGHSRGI